MGQGETWAVRVEAETWAHHYVIRKLVETVFADRPDELREFRENAISAVESVYGIPLSRHDADLLLQRTIAELEKLLAPLQPSDPRADPL